MVRKLTLSKTSARFVDASIMTPSLVAIPEAIIIIIISDCLLG